MALAWLFEDESEPHAEFVLGALPGNRILVPGHWFLEVANALLTAERRGRIEPADVQRAIALLEGLPIDVDARTSQASMRDVLAIAARHRLTSYDAAYLELCMREALPLATLDRDLLAASTAVGVAIL